MALAPTPTPSAFTALLEKGTLYLALLHLQAKDAADALERVHQAIAQSPDPVTDLVALFDRGWREQLVAGVGSLFVDRDPRLVTALWHAFDSGSWVSPQLAVLASILDPNFGSEARRRLLLRCPVIPRDSARTTDGAAPEGDAAEPASSVEPGSPSFKAMAALIERSARQLDLRLWMLSHMPLEEAVVALLLEKDEGGAQLAAAWADRLSELLPDRAPALAVDPELEPKDSDDYWLSRRLMGLWINLGVSDRAEDLGLSEEFLRKLLRTGVSESAVDFLDPLLAPAWTAGAEFVEFCGSGENSLQIVAVGHSHREILLEVPYPYSDLVVLKIMTQAVVSLGENQSRVGRIWRGSNRKPYGVRAIQTWTGNILQIRPLNAVPQRDSGPISIRQIRLEESGAELVAYGAKDTGSMAGGAAAALLEAAGPELENDLRARLAEANREIGVTVVTPAYRLEERFIAGVVHIISVRKHAEQGTFCPEPQRLADGVMRALELASQRKASTIAFSALGTGEGRVTSEQSARLMISATRTWHRNHPDSGLRVEFCLPSEKDYAAFMNVLAHPES